MWLAFACYPLAEVALLSYHRIILLPKIFGDQE